MGRAPRRHFFSAGAPLNYYAGAVKLLLKKECSLIELLFSFPQSLGTQQNYGGVVKQSVLSAL